MSTIDFKDDIVDEDGLLQYFSYGERMEKLYPLMKKAKETHASQKTTFTIHSRTCEFIVDKDGTASLRKKPVAGWW
ncbi:MAG TPA: hypothetical protein DIS62_05270 [Candidatus Kerfeldbacteria bacterium]|nr:MAG: hypothetical protein UY34_C0005G0040 [Parcubacteria group bacterium GW2011_GWA2_48_9]KKW16124.1 MAG: hypothetical protein UY52_C0010G0027 [Parcubacteria group bacterium GW2011_GWC2_49_9]HCJ52518.1 hypothetical protein [Candidatus Kerfeldbacteria bacterium]HCM68374.1 hypothetical protein [Candidatus Kerfeldbacteria bacterium]